MGFASWQPVCWRRLVLQQFRRFWLELGQDRQQGLPVTRVEAKEALIGRFAINGDDNKACVIDVFDFTRNGVCTTVALLRYPLENDLSIRSIDALFEDCSVFWDEIAADAFIAGNRAAKYPQTPDTAKSGKRAPVGPLMGEAHQDVALSDRIKAARVAAKLSSARLGKLIGVGEQLVKKWEKGTIVPSREELLRVAQATGILAQHLLPDGDDKKN